MCVRGGFPRSDRKKADAPKLNWTRDVFTRLANHTDVHKATSVGHDLITHYQNYLAEYEDEHPEDVSVPEAGDEPVEFERCEPKQVGKLPEGAGGAGDGATGRGQAGARRGPGRPRGSGRGARGGGRSRARVPRVKRRAASDFQVGCRVKVFWRAMDEWYSGVIEEQESSEGAEGGAEGVVEGAEPGGDAPEPVVLSKVVYDDGDVEVLDLVGGAEKVILLTYVDGSATSDAEIEPVFEPGDSEGDDSEEDETRGGGRGGSRRSTRDPRVSVSRRTLAKEENAPTRAPGGGPSARELRRRNPARAATAGNANDDDGDGEPDDARVRAVLERMKGNEAAKSLAELATDSEPPEEVFRVGYKMGARRAIACAAAVVAAAAARVGPAPERAAGVDPPRAKERTRESTGAGGRAQGVPSGAEGAGDGGDGGATAAAAAAVGVAASGARERRVRKKNSKYADDSDDDEDKSAKKAKKKKDVDDVDEKAAGGKAADVKGSKQDAKQDAKRNAKKGSKSKSESPGVDDSAPERSNALERELENLHSEVAELRREKAIREEGERRGEKLARDAAKEGGAWDDPIASAAADPTLTRVLAALEEILAKEVFDPSGWGDSDDDDDAYDGEDELDLGLPCADDDARGIDADAVRAVLGVDASAERWRAERGFNPNAARIAANQPGAAQTTSRGFPPPGSTASLPATTRDDPGPALAPHLPVQIQSPADIVAAAYEEARQKRAAADDAIANILDPAKLEQVRADAHNAKPTTTVGRLIKAANNAATRAERIAAGGGGDGRALRVAGVKRAGPGRPPGSTSRAARMSKTPKPARTRPSEADMMERCGPGADDYEFRPPLEQSARAAAAKAFEAAKPSENKRDEKALDEKPKGEKALDEKPRGDGGEEDGGEEKGEEKGGAAGWGDGGRVIDGDRRLTGWLTKRGWGEYAAAFAAKGFTRAGLGALTMQNLEDTVTDRADVREAIWGAIEEMRIREKEKEKDDGSRGREPARTPKSAKRPRTN